MNRAIGTLRALAFYTGYACFTIAWGSLSLLIAWALPFESRFRFIIQVWTGVVLWWLRWCCGITFRVTGMEHVPDKPCIVVSKHESTWETLALQQLFSPQATIVKRELLRIPFFGWAFALLKPIAIDRGNRRAALRALIEKGQRRLNDGIWVVLFPEGTRTEPGKVMPFQAGAGMLARSTDTPLLIVAHDAGKYWPARALVKNPGEVEVRIAPPVQPMGQDTKALLGQAEHILRGMMDQLYAEPTHTGDERS
ncbi:MAG: lysophospholipid acyltransferase family protein [Pseudomonadota bacterium]